MRGDQPDLPHRGPTRPAHLCAGRNGAAGVARRLPVARTVKPAAAASSRARQSAVASAAQLVGTEAPLLAESSTTTASGSRPGSGYTASLQRRASDDRGSIQYSAEEFL